MAFDTEKMNMDYRQLLKIPVYNRYTMAQSGLLTDIISMMTPTQVASLFPNYYKQNLPSISGFDLATTRMTQGTAGSGGGGSSYSQARYSGGGTGGGGGGGWGDNVSATSTVAQPVPDPVIKRIMNQAGIADTVDGVVKRDAGARGNLGYTQDTTMDPRKRALLDAIATDSGGGYGTINYVAKEQWGTPDVTDLTQGHPYEGIKGPTAAGRYQMLASNYETFAKKLGLIDPKTGKSDFTPEAQDKIAYEMAKDVYRKGTGGRNLDEDLQDPNISPDQLIRPLSIDYGWHILKTEQGMEKAKNVFSTNEQAYIQDVEAAKKEQEEKLKNLPPILVSEDLKKVIESDPSMKSKVEEDPRVAEKLQKAIDDGRITLDNMRDIIEKNQTSFNEQTTSSNIDKLGNVKVGNYNTIATPADDWLLSRADLNSKEFKGAEKYNMSTMDYAIRGMDPRMRMSLYELGQKYEKETGKKFQINSAFRDDYRQSLAEGFHAEPGMSRHGGSVSIGGKPEWGPMAAYGRGQAADLPAEIADWVSKQGAESGLVRSMPKKDPYHITSIFATGSKETKNFGITPDMLEAHQEKYLTWMDDAKKIEEQTAKIADQSQLKPTTAEPGLTGKAEMPIDQQSTGKPPEKSKETATPTSASPAGTVIDPLKTTVDNSIPFPIDQQKNFKAGTSNAGYAEDVSMIDNKTGDHLGNISSGETVGISKDNKLSVASEARTIASEVLPKTNMNMTNVSSVPNIQPQQDMQQMNKQKVPQSRPNILDPMRLTADKSFVSSPSFDRSMNRVVQSGNKYNARGVPWSNI